MNRFFVFPLVALLCSIGLISCMSNDFVDSNQVAADNDASIRQYITKQSNATSYSMSASGLHYVILNPTPTSKLPSVGEEVTFSYVLYNLADQALDSSKASQLPSFTFGLNVLLPGLQEGLSYMRVGETARLLIPSHLAYGSQGQTSPPVAGNTPIRLDVKLVSSLTEEQQITNYLSSTALTSSLSLTAPPTAVQTPTGLRIIKTVTNPTGASITAGQSVTLNYSGLGLRSLTPFDKVTDGSFSFVVGRDQFIAGFTEGVLQMRVGEKATIIFPSSLGYGTQGSRNASGQFVILPYSPLRFDISVLGAK